MTSTNLAVIISFALTAGVLTAPRLQADKLVPEEILRKDADEIGASGPKTVLAKTSLRMPTLSSDFVMAPAKKSLSRTEKVLVTMTDEFGEENEEIIILQDSPEDSEEAIQEIQDDSTSNKALLQAIEEENSSHLQKLGGLAGGAAWVDAEDESSSNEELLKAIEQENSWHLQKLGVLEDRLHWQMPAESLMYAHKHQHKTDALPIPEPVLEPIPEPVLEPVPEPVLEPDVFHEDAVKDISEEDSNEHADVAQLEEAHKTQMEEAKLESEAMLAGLQAQMNGQDTGEPTEYTNDNFAFDEEIDEHSKDVPLFSGAWMAPKHVSGGQSKERELKEIMRDLKEFAPLSEEQELIPTDKNLKGSWNGKSKEKCGTFEVQDD